MFRKEVEKMRKSLQGEEMRVTRAVGRLLVARGERPQGQLRAHQPGSGNVGVGREADYPTSPFPEQRQARVAGPSTS